MWIANNVEMLRVEDPNPHYPVLTWDDHEVVLIDTSYLGQIDGLSSEIKRCGFTLDQVTRVILTHQDIDHIGNAKLLREQGIELMAGQAEIPFIQGDEPLTKITDLSDQADRLEPGRRDFLTMLTTLSPKLVTPVDTSLIDGQLLPYCGGIQVVDTPGHTPGHICLFLKAADLIVCGDAANITNGVLSGPNPLMTHDMVVGMESFQKICSLGAAAYTCYHGGYTQQLPGA